MWTTADNINSSVFKHANLTDYSWPVNAKHTFLVAYSLHIYRVKALPVNKVTFVLGWPLYTNVGTVDTTDDSGKTALVQKTFLDLLHFFRRWPLNKLRVLACKCSRNPSNYSWNRALWNASNRVADQLQETTTGLVKKSKVTRTCTSGSSAWFLEVCRSMSDLIRLEINSIDSVPNL